MGDIGMAGTKAQRVVLWAGAVIVVLLLAVVGGGFFVAHEMKARVLEALGPLGSVEDIDVGYARIPLSRVRLGPARLAHGRHDASRARDPERRHARPPEQPRTFASRDGGRLLSRYCPFRQWSRRTAAQSPAVDARGSGGFKRSRRTCARRSDDRSRHV